MNPQMAALEFGTNYWRFAELCGKLVEEGLLTPTGLGGNKLKSFNVVKPEEWEEEEISPLTPDQMDDAIDFFEHLQDQLSDQLDEEDEEDWT
jgi:hypothetical protein